MRPHGRARVNARNPQAFAICDRCGFLTNHVRLKWQFDWTGATVQNRRILVCDTCLDRPQEQLRALVIPADPVPIQNPRVQDYVAASEDVRTTSGQNTVDPTTGLPVIGGDTIVAPVDLIVDSLYSLTMESGDGFILLEDRSGRIGLEPSTEAGIYTRVPQQTGEPPGGLNPTPGVDVNAPGGEDPGLPYNNIVIPETGQE